MKRTTLLFIFVLGATALMNAQGKWSFKGTVIKMRMAECASQHGFMANMSGAAAPPTTCPEYTIMSDKVVYVVEGRQKDAFMPLAENMDFLVRKNELITFSDDEKDKSRFVIRQMTLRAEWDREEERKELAARIAEREVSYETRNPPRASMLSTSAR